MDVHTPDIYSNPRDPGQRREMFHGGHAADVVECWLAVLVQHLCEALLLVAVTAIGCIVCSNAADVTDSNV